MDPKYQLTISLWAGRKRCGGEIGPHEMPSSLRWGRCRPAGSGQRLGRSSSRLSPWPLRMPGAVDAGTAASDRVTTSEEDRNGNRTSGEGSRARRCRSGAPPVWNPAVRSGRESLVLLFRRPLDHRVPGLHGRANAGVHLDLVYPVGSAYSTAVHRTGELVTTPERSALLAVAQGNVALHGHQCAGDASGYGTGSRLRRAPAGYSIGRITPRQRVRRRVDTGWWTGRGERRTALARRTAPGVSSAITKRSSSAIVP